MTHCCLRISQWTLVAYSIAYCGAMPGIAFPFNSQVPNVARVGEAYNFQFSASTFIPDTSNFTYSLSDQPNWLLLDSATRTLSGAPSQADTGVSSFTLTAADITGAAHMPCVLVVSTDPPPQIEWSISEQLAATTNLSSSQPPVVTLLPSTPFHFEFRHDSFIDIVQRKLSYYATLADHTPLPSWLTFDDQSLSFTGTAPDLSASPQSWEVDLIASDIEGFAGAAASFTLAIGKQQLVFVPEQQEVNTTAGAQLDFDGLANTLFFNGNKVDPRTLKSADASLPAWLTFDPQTFAVSGVVPTPASQQEVVVTAVDQAGNTATAAVSLVPSDLSPSLFTQNIPVLTAYYGKPFDYHFPSTLFKSQNILLMVVLPETASWLHFDSAVRNLSGTVPTKTSQQDIKATIVAKASDAGPAQSQTFTIKLQVPLATSTTTSKTTTRAATTPTTEATPSSLIVVAERYHLNPGAVAGIIVGTVALAAIIAVFLVLCWRRRRRDDGYVEDTNPKKRTISRPILPTDAAGIGVSTDVQIDVEKHMDAPANILAGPIEPPPQIALDLPVQAGNKRMKWNKRFSRISQTSSIGNGEVVIRADENIPNWGLKSTARHQQHDSFSVPTEIARSSRQMNELSPTKRALRMLRENRKDRQSIGLGVGLEGGAVVSRRSSKRERRERESLGHSTIHERGSMLSMSTRGTSVLSTRPSDFPRPPTRSTMGGSRSIPTLGNTGNEQRKSIRLVARSDSTLDNRSLQEKRQSFIRNRASTTLASPLFAHGSRALSDPRQNGRSSTQGSLAGSNRRSRRGKSQLTTYSESSSLEPPPRDPRRLSARLRSAFALSYQRDIARSSQGGDAQDREHDEEASTEYASTDSSIKEADLAAESALPRHQRSWVIPGEASPTPPPALQTSRQASSARSMTPMSGNAGSSGQKRKGPVRDMSSSPLATAVAMPVEELSASAPVEQRRRSKLGEPMSLVSTDSLSRGKLERPRLVQTPSKRPVSVEKVQRWSSLKAETEDAQAGGKMEEEDDEELDGVGLMPRGLGAGGNGTQRSDMSGPAFL